MENMCRVEEVKNRPSVCSPPFYCLYLSAARRLDVWRGGVGEEGSGMFSFPAQPLRLQAAGGEGKGGGGREGGRQTEESRWKREI